VSSNSRPLTQTSGIAAGWKGQDTVPSCEHGGLFMSVQRLLTMTYAWIMSIAPNAANSCDEKALEAYHGDDSIKKKTHKMG